MSVTLLQAQRMARAAVAKSREIGVSVSVAIGDEHGDPILLHRMDGSGVLTVHISLNMLHTAALFRSRGSELVQWFHQPWFQSVMMAEGGRIVPASGATPVSRRGALIATIGVSGGSDEQDRDIADAALAAL